MIKRNKYVWSVFLAVLMLVCFVGAPSAYAQESEMQAMTSELQVADEQAADEQMSATQTSSEQQSLDEAATDTSAGATVATPTIDMLVVETETSIKVNTDADIITNANTHEESADETDPTQGTQLDTPSTEPNPTLTAAAENSVTLQAAADVTTVDMYRLYNPNSGEHFYTASKDERANLVKVGWRFEGIGWVAPFTGNPVYRLYSGTDHHYTMSAEERDWLITKGWKYENIGWYSDPNQTVALLRQFNPNVDPTAKCNNSGSHNYTTSTAERDNLVSLGWMDETVGWYALEGAKTTTEFSYIYLDAGHGWNSSYTGQYDSGAVGSGYKEAEETAALAQLTAQYARDLYGLNVYTNAYATAATGVHYRLRQQDAKNRGCTSLVSIHFNAVDAGLATGTESYIHSINAASGSDQLQDIMHAALVGSLGLKDRGQRSAEFAVVSGKNTGLPAVLLETCFIDNPSDMSTYRSKRDAVARALAQGLYQAAQAGF